MGYDVHITRADNWFDSASQPITLSEWLDYVAGDPEMRLDNAAEAQGPDGQTLRYENQGLAVWTAYSGHGVGGNMAWFDYRDGRVVVKNPDEEILRKMCRVAAQLGARVQGDEGAFYDEAGLSKRQGLRFRVRRRGRLTEEERRTRRLVILVVLIMVGLICICLLVRLARA